VKFKLDENLGPSVKVLFQDAGFDTMLVREQGLGGSDDPPLLAHCSGECRCLVTLDAEFGNLVKYPPESHSGVVLLRTPPRATLSVVLSLTRTFLAAIPPPTPRPSAAPTPGLWIVQPGRVREYRSASDVPTEPN
jgi:predicted nuclease of predicted toxin-antitoxin system